MLLPFLKQLSNIGFDQRIVFVGRRGRSTTNIKDQIHLSFLFISWKQDSSKKEFSKQTTQTPYINSITILSDRKEQFRRSVPKSHYFVGIVKPSVRVKNSCKSKICYFYHSIFIDQYVCSFNISMNYMVFMQIDNSLKNLFHYALQLTF